MSSLTPENNRNTDTAACARHGSDYMTDDGVCLHCEAEIPDAEWGADPRDSQDDLGKPVPVESLLDEDDFAVLREEADPDAR